MSQQRLWVIIGGGISGLGAAELLASRNETARVSDGAVMPPEKRAEFERLGVEVCDGGHQLEHLHDATDVVLSPSVTLDNPLHAAARERHLGIHTELDLALSDYAGTIVAITGTNGKSTTCVMVDHLFKRLGLQSQAGGNLGEPPTRMAAREGLAPFLSLEVSSYQLEFTRTLRPRAAIFTSFSHDHLKRHGTMEHYMAAKLRVFENLKPHDLAIFPLQVWEAFATYAPKTSLPPNSLCILPHEASLTPPSGLSRWVRFSTQNQLTDEHGKLVLDLSASGIHERHNLLNAAVSIFAVAHSSGRHPQELVPLLKDFQGLPFRCQQIGLWQGQPVINDSKSTNVESTLTALASQNTPALLILGGQGKDESFLPLLALRDRIDRVIAVGFSGPAIASELAPHLPLTRCPTLADALERLEELRGKTPLPILFSPGCASFDEFKNFEHRGAFFNERMKRLMVD